MTKPIEISDVHSTKNYAVSSQQEKCFRKIRVTKIGCGNESKSWKKVEKAKIGLKKEQNRGLIQCGFRIRISQNGPDKIWVHNNLAPFVSEPSISSQLILLDAAAVFFGCRQVSCRCLWRKKTTDNSSHHQLLLPKGFAPIVADIVRVFATGNCVLGIHRMK